MDEWSDGYAIHNVKPPRRFKQPIVMAVTIVLITFIILSLVVLACYVDFVLGLGK